MSRTWTPTAFGKVFTRAGDWSLTLGEAEVELHHRGRVVAGSILRLVHADVRPGFFWATVTLGTLDGATYVLEGLPNRAAQELVRALRELPETYWRENSERALVSIVRWTQGVRTSCESELRTRGWLTSPFLRGLAASRPSGLEIFVERLVAKGLAESQAPEVREALKVWEWDPTTLGARLNERHQKRQQQLLASFFESVESKPLSGEQVEAVTCLDERVLLVAAAGSGKTSTMVAKAGYVLKNGYCAPERMVLLSFNTSAAKELAERLEDRLTRVGIASEGVSCKTFHGLGMEIIGRATGKKPTVAKWVADREDPAFLHALAQEVMQRDLAFRMRWDMFRTTMGPELQQAEDEADEYDRNTGKGGKPRFRTLKGDLVRSPGERIIADWLFCSGIAYEYERPYEHDVADETHSQYRPDFYLIDLGAYLEHWALDADGQPPKAFRGYLDGMEWKRAQHRRYGTRLLQTTKASLYDGRALVELEREIRELGGEPRWDPDRETPGRQPIESVRLAELMRSFMIHAKSNRLSLDDLRAQAAQQAWGPHRYRTENFLHLYEQLATAWERRLREEQCIDFEDMLNRAADHVERGDWTSPYDLVMVDEFQDSSRARVRLLQGLMKAPRARLFAVGDDWQSINRFAGADLSAMTQFEEHFGSTVTLRLQATFRCPQALCDISSDFVTRNPRQLRKYVRSQVEDRAMPVRVLQVSHERAIAKGIAHLLGELSRSEAPGRKPSSVLFLGRYRRDVAYLPAEPQAPSLDVRFSTVHAAKGQEADHVIVVRVTAESRGFPSQIADDPVLRLAMPDGEGFPFAEERRAFYVALTRARKSLVLITVAGKESPFIRELVSDGRVPMTDVQGQALSTRTCPGCRQGFMVPRSGRFGDFYGCSSYPACTYTEKP